MQINSYTSKGNKGKSVAFPKEWQEKANDVLLAHAIRVYEARKHPGLSKVKTRGEVAHSTRKIYRQKGTGSARHGDRGAPIFVKGGVAHGPKGVKKGLSLPKKIYQKALKIALTEKAKQGLIFVLENVSQFKSTKEVMNLIKNIINKEEGIGRKSKFTFVLSKEVKKINIFFRNIQNVKTSSFAGLNTYNVFHGGVIMIDERVLTNKQESGNSKSKITSKGRNTKSKKVKEITKAKAKKSLT